MKALRSLLARITGRRRKPRKPDSSIYPMF
jgi:hypothetical protein